MAGHEILLLGNPLLYQKCDEVHQDELSHLKGAVQDLHDTMMDFRARHGVGRAISAPQIGVMKRLVYMHIDEPTVFVNPVLTNLSDEMFELWDDCMSFPELLVRVSRHKSCTITFRDMDWNTHSIDLSGNLSELLQHECDHLDGVLAVSRAIDEKSFAHVSQRPYLSDKNVTKP
jgi:peptide deformylase